MISDSALAEAFWRDGRCDECPVIDMHGHMGRWRGIWFMRGSTDQMIHTMDQAGVRMLVFCHHGALFSPEIGNRANIEAVRRYPDRLRAYVGINPNYPDAIERDLAAFDDNRDVFVGLKILASYHQVPWTDARFEPAWRFANERKMMVLGHTWGGAGEFDRPPHVRAIAAKYPDVRLLCGHAMHSAWDEAIEIARKHPNVYLELTAVLDDRGALEYYVDAGLADKCLYGTDLPWFDEHYYIGAVLSARISDADRHKVLHRNAERLLAEAGVTFG